MRWRRIGRVVAAALLTLALLSTDRLLHPARYAVTGDALLLPDAYAAAARPLLGRGERIAHLALPAPGGPVVMWGEAGSAVYLDPPTAAPLDRTAGENRRQPRPARWTALSAAEAVARAEAAAPGMARLVQWPTERVPDWRIEVGADPARTVIVADDAAVTLVLRPTPAAMAPSWLALAILAVLGTMIALALWRRARAGRRGLSARAAPAPGRRSAPASPRWGPTRAAPDPPPP